MKPEIVTLDVRESCTVLTQITEVLFDWLVAMNACFGKLRGHVAGIETEMPTNIDDDRRLKSIPLRKPVDLSVEDFLEYELSTRWVLQVQRHTMTVSLYMKNLR